MTTPSDDDLEQRISSAIDENMEPAKPSDEQLAEYKNDGRVAFAKGLPREAPRGYHSWPYHEVAWYAGYDAAAAAYVPPKGKPSKPRDRVARAEKIAAVTSGVTEEHSGGSVSYYVVDIQHPTHQPAPYTVECNDIIEALEMDYAEGSVFKAIWRTAAARQGKLKKGNDAKYDAEKIVFFGQRLLERAKRYLAG